VTDASEEHEGSASQRVNQRVRVVIADDLPEVLDAVEQRLNPQYEIVGRAKHGVALVESVGRLQPDILLFGAASILLPAKILFFRMFELALGNPQSFSGV
jgi:DNA-binding NarL/FixJ family response regulator